MTWRALRKCGRWCSRVPWAGFRLDTWPPKRRHGLAWAAICCGWSWWKCRLSSYRHPGARIAAVKAHGAGKGDDMTIEEMQAELAKIEAKHAGALDAAVASAVAPYVQRLGKLGGQGQPPPGG